MLGKAAFWHWFCYFFCNRLCLKTELYKSHFLGSLGLPQKCVICLDPDQNTWNHRELGWCWPPPRQPLCLFTGLGLVPGSEWDSSFHLLPSPDIRGSRRRPCCFPCRAKLNKSCSPFTKLTEEQRFALLRTTHPVYFSKDQNSERGRAHPSWPVGSMTHLQWSLARLDGKGWVSACFQWI